MESPKPPHPLLLHALQQNKRMFPDGIHTIDDMKPGVSLKVKDLNTDSILCIETWLDEDKQIARKVTCVTEQGVQRIHEEKVFHGCALRTSRRVIQKDGSCVEEVVVTTVDENPRIINRFKIVSDTNGQETRTFLPLTA